MMCMQLDKALKCFCPFHFHLRWFVCCSGQTYSRQAATLTYIVSFIDVDASCDPVIELYKQAFVLQETQTDDSVKINSFESFG